MILSNFQKIENHVSKSKVADNGTERTLNEKKIIKFILKLKNSA